MAPQTPTHHHPESASAEKQPAFFFKIILPPALDNNRLNIPTKFVQEFSEDLSSTAKFVVPGDQTWDIRIHFKGSKFWFGDGLGEFFENYNVSCGFFFVFDYRGDSEFGVRIFDLTTCEINYRSPLADLLIPEDEDDDPNANNASEGDDDDVVVMNRKESNESNSRSVHELSEGDDDDDDDRNYDPDHEEKPNIVSRSPSPIEEPSSRKRKLEDTAGSRKTKKMDLRADKDSFEMVLKAYNVNNSLFNVPAHIGCRYPKGGSGSVMLEGPDGKTWTVQGHISLGKLRQLSKGWAEFVREYNLSIGMVCLFELIESDKEFRIRVTVK